MFTTQLDRKFTRLRIVNKIYYSHINYIGKITLTQGKNTKINFSFTFLLIRNVLLKNTF